jgi:phage-related protein
LDVFDLVAKIRLDSSEYEQGVGKAKGTMSTLASGVGKGLATVAKVGAAAVSAGVAGVTALTKMGVEGYAQYEQLVGGVETLFKESGNAVMKYAENAYKTSGLSSNAYMETVTSFSASLIKSLDGDTAKAAKVADMAITDMSDNANKMGTSIDMIQNAYNGFAKGNFTMLDNLKLGYGGTQEEMKKLLKDAEKISGIKYDISSFADISEAIHVIQQDLEISGISYEEAMQKVANGEMTMEEAMNAMGTTAREAATTIEGSLSMMKGAWENLVVGMADENADMETLINNFVESTAMAAQNLLPRIEQTLIGIGQLITALAPVIAEALPQLVKAVLPAILQAAISLVTALVQGIITALPAVYDALLIGVQTILVEVFGVSETKAGEFADSVNSFFVKIGDGFKKLVKSAQTEGTWLNGVWTGLKDTCKVFCDFCVALWDVLSAAFTWCVDQINTEGTVLNIIWENIKTAISMAINYIKGVISVFTAVLKGDWSGAWTAVKETAQSVWDAICEVWGRVGGWFDKNVVQPINEAVVKPIIGFFTNLWESVVAVWDWICNAINVAIMLIVSIIDDAFQLITLPFRFIWENCKEYVFAAFEWIKEKIAAASEWISQKVAVVWGWIRDNIVTPVKDAYKKAVEIFNNIKTAISEKITAIKSKVTEIFNSIKEKMRQPIEAARTAISNTVNSIKTTFSNGLNAAKTTVSSILDGIKNKFTSIFEGAKNIVKNAINAIKGFFKFNVELPKIKLPHFGISPSGWQIGDLLKGKIPRLSIQWYKKAYDNAMVLSNPTIFGYSNGNFLGGGDGNGNEIVAGESHLMGMIGKVVESRTADANAKVVALLGAILETMTDGNTEMVRALMADRTFAVGEREFARLVKQYA